MVLMSTSSDARSQTEVWQHRIGVKLVKSHQIHFTPSAKQTDRQTIKTVSWPANSLSDINISGKKKTIKQKKGNEIAHQKIRYLPQILSSEDYILTTDIIQYNVMTARRNDATTSVTSHMQISFHTQKALEA